METRTNESGVDLPTEALELYGCAVQLIAGADGQLAKAELDMLYADARYRGVPEGILRAWRTYDWRSDSIENIVPRLRPCLSEDESRMLIYNAIRIARADGTYRTEESDAVRKAARILGMTDATVGSLEVLAALEQSVTDLRGLLFNESSAGPHVG